MDLLAAALAGTGAAGAMDQLDVIEGCGIIGGMERIGWNVMQRPSEMGDAQGFLPGIKSRCGSQLTAAWDCSLRRLIRGWTQDHRAVSYKIARYNRLMEQREVKPSRYQ